MIGGRPSGGKALLKLLRYARLYGAKRALVKAAGRGAPIPRAILKRGRGAADVSIIGCGQAAFGTLCFFLRQNRKQRFLQAYDPQPKQAQRTADFYGLEQGISSSAGELLDNPGLRAVYIASNHASHAGYAAAALRRGVDVFVEKPIATSWEDLQLLEAAVGAGSGKLFAGYNRPFAPAIAEARDLWEEASIDDPFTCQCRVEGHVIPYDHWYRHPAEGTRICGNAGHWLDLFVHLTSAIREQLPTHARIELIPENPAEPDDNYRLTVDIGIDTLVLHFTSYRERRDGVHEHILLTCGSSSVEINDFRSAITRDGDRVAIKRYRPKDVGHRACTLQPWLPADEQRNIEEVWCSARLVLHAADLARRGGGVAEVDLSATPPASFEAA